MLTATPAVQNLLAGWLPTSQISMADLYQFILAGGETLYYSGYQAPVVAPPPGKNEPLYTFPLGPKFERKSIKRQIGTQVSELEVDVYAGDNDALALGSNLSWQEALWAGLFDGAYCRVWRAYINRMPLTTGTDAGRVYGTSTLFYGRIGDVDIGRTKITVRVKSLLDLLTTQMPKRLFQPGCTFDFGDYRCGYNRVAGVSGLGIATGIGAVAVAALAGSDQNSITTGFVPNPTTAYDNGTITGTSGPNNGYSRTIAQLGAGVVYMLKPWIFPVADGDGFQLLPGCDHTLATCVALQNQASDGSSGRFGGFPYIPPPETAV